MVTPRSRRAVIVSGIIPSPHGFSIGGAAPSARVTLKPFWRAAIAAARPDGPPPTTNTSVVLCRFTTGLLRGIACPGLCWVGLLLPLKRGLLRAGSNIDGPARHVERFGPESCRRLRQFHDVANRRYELVELLFVNDERRRGLQNHEVVAANLREESFFAIHPHHNHLPEHRRMDRVKRLVHRPSREFFRRRELDAVQEAHAAHFLDHVAAGEFVAKFLAKSLAKTQSARPKFFAFKDI